MDTYNSIFGVAAPQFEYDGDVIELDYIKIVEDAPESRDIVHESVINWHREWDRYDKHWIFTIDLHLYKYPDPQATFDMLMSYKRKLVKLWRRRDGQPFKNSADESVLFRVNRIVWLYYEESGDFEDVLRISFVSQDPINISKTMAL